MSDEVEVRECGEIVAHGESSDLWADPRADGMWGVYVTRRLRGAPATSDINLTSAQLAAWCRRVLREIEGDRHAAGDELMRVLGVLVGDPGRSSSDDAWMRRTLDILRRRPETDPAWEPVPVDVELREVDPDPVPTVDELMAAWGVRDLQVRVASRPNESLRVVVNSDEVMWREAEISLAGAIVPAARTRFSSVIGIGDTHAEALRNALANAAGPWGDLP